MREVRDIRPLSREEKSARKTLRLREKSLGLFVIFAVLAGVALILSILVGWFIGTR